MNLATAYGRLGDAARQRRIQQCALHSAKKAATAASVGLLARSLAAARLRGGIRHEPEPKVAVVPQVRVQAP